MAPIILLQQWNSRRRRFTTITGQFKPQLFTLGRAKWPAFAIVFFLVSLMTLVPVGFMLVGSFMKLVWLLCRIRLPVHSVALVHRVQ